MDSTLNLQNILHQRVMVDQSTLVNGWSLTWQLFWSACAGKRQAMGQNPMCLPNKKVAWLSLVVLSQSHFSRGLS